MGTIFEPNEDSVSLFIYRSKCMSESKAERLNRPWFIRSMLVLAPILIIGSSSVNGILAATLLIAFSLYYSTTGKVSWSQVTKNKSSVFWGIMAMLFAPGTSWNDFISQAPIGYVIGTLLSKVMMNGFIIGYFIAYILTTILGFYSLKRVIGKGNVKEPVYLLILDSVLWACLAISVMLVLNQKVGWFNELSSVWILLN